MQLFLFLISTSLLVAQNDVRMAYVSGQVGGFISADKTFSKTYDNNLCLAISAGFGVPITNDLFICWKAIYISKKGVPYFSIYDQNGHFVSERKIINGTSIFHQWLVNVGVQYNFKLFEGIDYGINGGATYTNIFDKSKFTHDYFGPIESSRTGSGILGFYIGFSFEKYITGYPIGIVMDAQYNSSQKDIMKDSEKYGGTNISIGLHYYFLDRRK
jgi:hypothetical protein